MAEANAYIWLTDLLGFPRNDSKDCQETVVTVFGIEVDTSSFMARLPQDKLEEAILGSSKVLSQRAVSYIDIQSLVGYFSFCSQDVELGPVFMRRLCYFINNYSRDATKSTLRRFPVWVRDDLEWWNKLLPTYNGVLSFWHQEQGDSDFLHRYMSLQPRRVLFSRSTSLRAGESQPVRTRCKWSTKAIQRIFICVSSLSPSQKGTNGWKTGLVSPCFWEKWVKNFCYPLRSWNKSQVVWLTGMIFSERLCSKIFDGRSAMSASDSLTRLIGSLSRFFKISVYFI